jgi:hypothetical protein
MSDDQRWLKAVALIEAGKAADDAGDAMEFMRLYSEHLKVLETIAADPNAAEDDRAEAKAILDEVEVQARAAAPDALRTLGQIARDPLADDDVRAEALKTLADAAERIPAASDTLSRPTRAANSLPIANPAGPSARRGFSDSRLPAIAHLPAAAGTA